VFVPADGAATPDSGFQSPEQIFRGQSHLSSHSPENSSVASSNLYMGDIPRHLAEEHPLDSFKDLSVEDSYASSSSDVIEVDHFTKMDNVQLNLPANYVVRDMIGSGGFAKVYHCIDQDTGRDLAVKQVFFDPQCSDSNRELNALKNEISILRKLEHPNIVVYYGSNIKDGHFNIFMEYVSGGSMRSFIQNNGPLSNKYTVKCLNHILLGLSYLHHETIIHRDLKAANVLKTSDGTIKIADFGASKRFDTLRSIHGANTVVGTPYWMSPEVIRAQSKYL
jgi:serine/threonine protein kinase